MAGLPYPPGIGLQLHEHDDDLVELIVAMATDLGTGALGSRAERRELLADRPGPVLGAHRRGADCFGRARTGTHGRVIKDAVGTQAL